jgi:hypothetical protein
MRNYKILLAVICAVLLSTAFSCTPQNAASDNVTDMNGPTIEAQYTAEEVQEIARDFSPDCRKKILPQEGKG